MALVYANPGSGVSSGGIGWFNFGNLTINPGQSLTGQTGTLSDGSTVTFDLKLDLISGVARSFVATQTPTLPGTNFGGTGYAGIAGNVALYSEPSAAAAVSTFTLSNLVVKDSDGKLITNYNMIIADAERTNLNEKLSYTTNGLPWKVVDLLGTNPPTIVGLNTNTVAISGLTLQSEAAYVLSSANPTNVSMTVTNGLNGRVAIAIGFAVTKLLIKNNIGKRIDVNDQFELIIGGVPTATAITSGSTTGIQTESAALYITSGNTYTITEAMAAGSGSLLSDYSTMISATNAIVGGTTPPLGALPITVTPALGDDLTYTILNASPHVFSKRVDKAYADLGDVLNYTITVNNPNAYTITNILVTDVLALGTTYIGNLAVSVPFSGTTPMTGLTLASIAPNSFATVSWQVKVNIAMPLITPIVNVANINIPGGTSGNSNIVVTAINHADLTSTGNFLKSVDKSFAKFGEELTYTLTLHNTGNAAANNVVVTDSIPIGTTYVANSVTASVTISGNPISGISLTAPIEAGGGASISFKVKINNAIPLTNPISNIAKVAYAYTVDSSTPNAATSSGNSNTVMTAVSTARLLMEKTTNKEIGYIGDIITYSISVKNTGNISANNVIINDVIPSGVTYVPGSISVTVPFTNAPPCGIQLTNAIVPGEVVTVSFQVKVKEVPNPNPLINKATSTFLYTIDPANPNEVLGSSASNSVNTIIFRYNFNQQITDLIQSIALEEAALAAIADAEGAKIQKMVADGTVTNKQLLCLNKSVAEMTESITTLESILKQKLNVVSCQISGVCK